MPIIYASDLISRPEAQRYLAKKKAQGTYRVLDVGGVASQCWDEWADAVADIQEGADIVGDICYESTWKKIEAAGPWDFIVCTHTLEDIRNPELSLYWMQRVASAGFIAVPNKHTELCPRIESEDWAGYSHHRWIFSVRDGVVRITAKWPATGAFRNTPPAWWDGSKVSPGTYELGFLWEESFPYEFIRDDFAGQASAGWRGIIQMYRDELKDGL